MKVLIIKLDDSSFENTINNWFVKEGCDVLTIKELSDQQKGIKKIYAILKNITIFKVKSYDKIIVFDDFVIFMCINKLLSKNDVFLWYWNTISSSFSARLFAILSSKTGNAYTFDYGDALKYRLKINTQFLKYDNIHERKVKYDLYFVGNDKGRYDLVNDIYHVCKDKNIHFFSQLVPESGKEYKSKDILSGHHIEYNDVLENIAQSNAVLDLCKDGQIGPTLRAMEAVFLEKKIVTNNKKYMELPFYSDHNVFILDKGNLSEMVDFLKNGVAKYPNNIKEYYSIKNWILRFE